MTVLQQLRERFWFLPTLLCVAAAVLAEGLVAVDQAFSGLNAPPWVQVLFYRVGESGSRDVLGAIASSSLAVAGTTFSITMAVLALTSSTYGPRLVRNFMTDRGNQMVLGVYVATFLYTLLVLRSIRVIGDPGDQQGEVFVPHLAVNAAMLLAVANVVVLIYFIHHISDSIQVATLASGVRSNLRSTVERLFPDEIGSGGAGGDDPRDAAPPGSEGAPVTASRPGYLQSVRNDDLMKAAVKHDVLLVLRLRPGQYVLEGGVLASVHPPERMSEQLRHAVRSVMKITDARTPFQDVDFAVQQLTEMAVRALSPGTNDPYTALNALDDLSSGLVLLAEREPPSPARYDDQGVLRVHAPGADAQTLVVQVLDSMRWYATSAPLVMHRCLDLAHRVGSRSRHPALRAVLVEQVRLLKDGFEAADHHPHDVRAFAEHADEVVAGLLPAHAGNPGPGAG